MSHYVTSEGAISHSVLYYQQLPITRYNLRSGKLWVRSFSFPRSTPVWGVFVFQDERVQTITHVRPGKKPCKFGHFEKVPKSFKHKK